MDNPLNALCAEPSKDRRKTLAVMAACTFTIVPPSPEKDSRPLQRFFVSTGSTEMIRQGIVIDGD